MSNITLQLEVFEGPLDLLLYLIKKHDLEISRVSLAEVTDQYLLYLDQLKEVDVDTASDFLYMASELAYIKSKLLLPGDETEDEEVGEVADDLVARLKQYEKYKLAAEDLKKRPWLNRDVFGRGAFAEEQEPEEFAKPADPDQENFDVDTFELIKAFYEVLNRLPKEQFKHQVLGDRVSVTERIYEFLELLNHAESILFTDMFKSAGSRMEVVVSFLAILEMAKLKLVTIYQAAIFEPIRLKRRIEINEEAMTKGVGIELNEDYR